MPKKYRFKIYDPRGYVIYLECEFEDPKKLGRSYALQAYLFEDLARNLVPVSERAYERWKEKLRKRETLQFGRFRVLKIVRSRAPPKTTRAYKK